MVNVEAVLISMVNLLELWEIGKTLLLSNGKSSVRFQLEYFCLTLTNSKGQAHTYFDSAYLGNGDRRSKRYYYHQLESREWAFDWQIYIWPWLIVILKTKVRDCEISTVNILNMVTDMKNIIIAIRF